MTGDARLASTSSSTSPGPGVKSLRWLVIPFFPLHAPQLHLCQAQELERVLVDAVFLVIDDTYHTCIDQHLGALDTGEMGDIASGAFGAHPMQGSLDDGIGFRMDGAHAGSIHDQMAGFITMG